MFRPFAKATARAAARPAQLCRRSLPSPVTARFSRPGGCLLGHGRQRGAAFFSTTEEGAKKEGGGEAGAGASGEGDKVGEGESKSEGESKEPTTEELLAKKDEELKEMKDKLLRNLADMQNLRDRTARDSENAKKYAIQKFSQDLLQVADTLEMAMTAAADKAEAGDKEFKNFFDGIVLTEKSLQQVFGRHGITKFDPLGEKFDPNKHDGLFQYEDKSKEAGTVGQVVKVGYMLKDMVLRPAGVGTIKAPPASS